MKKSILLSLAVSTLVMASHPIGDAGHALDGSHKSPVQSTHTGSSIINALKDGKFSFKTRTFYMIRTFESTATTPSKDSAEALTFGGILKYESAAWNNFKVGLAYYGNHSLGFFDRADGVGTSNLQTGNGNQAGDDITFLGEAYLQYNNANTMIKVGRQQLATPLIQNHDLRALPSVYEAAIIRNKDIPNTMIELGYVRAYSGFVSRDSRFNDYNSKWGKDGLAYISFKNTSIDDLSVRGQYIIAIDDQSKSATNIAVEDYKYLDAKYNLSFGTKTYLKAQYGGNGYQDADDSTMYGVKVGTSFGILDTALVFNDISNNSFKAVESGPMYTDWQQGYGNYEPSTAIGGQLVFKPMKELSLKVGYVDVSANEGNLRDDFSEFNFDGKYAINSSSKIRVRYSFKNQTNESENAISGNLNGSSGREDRQDFRVIYYLNF
ncbi:MAG: hypothetical protein COB17_06605 [Sulfurimonas sp.]|nr:MAG: hypothetical protein COB17_06605 [Sulfurimonas sp.]